MNGTVRQSVHWALASRLLSAAVESLSCDLEIDQKYTSEGIWVAQATQSKFSGGM